MERRGDEAGAPLNRGGGRIGGLGGARGEARRALAVNGGEQDAGEDRQTEDRDVAGHGGVLLPNRCDGARAWGRTSRLDTRGGENVPGEVCAGAYPDFVRLALAVALALITPALFSRPPPLPDGRRG